MQGAGAPAAPAARDGGSLRLHRIGVVARRSPGGLRPVMERVLRFAEEHGIELAFEKENLSHAPRGSRAMDLEAEPLDLILSLGGDGTLLRATRIVYGRAIPVLGINIGHLGFLTAAGENELEEALERLGSGDFLVDRRFTLKATVWDENGEQAAEPFHALNDFVIHKAGMARVTRLDLSVGHGDEVDEIGNFSADGVIVATPTGSTAYSMSAGGPIVVPEVECIVVTAICPHTLAVRPLVIPASYRLRIRALDRPENLELTVDGQEGWHLMPGDEVTVDRGAVEIPLIRFPGRSFFSTMRRKLNWAIRAGERG